MLSTSYQLNTEGYPIQIAESPPWILRNILKHRLTIIVLVRGHLCFYATGQADQIRYWYLKHQRFELPAVSWTPRPGVGKRQLFWLRLWGTIKAKPPWGDIYETCLSLSKSIATGFPTNVIVEPCYSTGHRITPLLLMPGLGRHISSKRYRITVYVAFFSKSLKIPLHFTTSIPVSYDVSVHYAPLPFPSSTAF